MSFNRPTLSTLIDRAVSDIRSNLQDVVVWLRRKVLNVLAKMHAGGLHGLYGNLDWLAEQLMPDTAEKEHMERWASIWGVSRKAAKKASGPVIFTGNDGSVVPAGSLLQRADGFEYKTDSDANISGGSATATVTAEIGGTQGNTEAGVTLTLSTPLPGVQSDATVDTAGITNGTNTEVDEDLRSRLLDRIRKPPYGGAAFDYVRWALEVSGVTRAWCYENHMSLGTVGVTFVCDDQTPSIIPDVAKVTEVENYIENHIDPFTGFPVGRPVTADIYVFAPIAVSLNLTITLTPDTSLVRDAVESELKDLVRRDGEPGGTLLISRIREAISVAAGEENHVLVSPTADVSHSTGELPVLGTITWA